MKSAIKDGVLVIAPEGNVLSSDEKKPVMQLLKDNFESGNHKVLFDLSETRFMNSSGLEMLLISVARVKHVGGDTAICNIPEEAKKVFNMTKLQGFFHEQPNQTEGIRFLNSLNVAAKAA